MANTVKVYTKESVYKVTVLCSVTVQVLVQVLAAPLAQFVCAICTEAVSLPERFQPVALCSVFPVK